MTGKSRDFSRAKAPLAKRSEKGYGMNFLIINLIGGKNNAKCCIVNLFIAQQFANE